jgi:gas vesicle protein
MQNYSDEHEQNGHTAVGFLAGLVIGGLAGAVTTLLMAPQSGERTRDQIQRKSIALRDQTVAGVEGAVAQTRARAGQFTAGMREKAGELQQRGQDMVDGQKKRWVPVVEASQKAVNGGD